MDDMRAFRADNRRRFWTGLEGAAKKYKDISDLDIDITTIDGWDMHDDIP